MAGTYSLLAEVIGEGPKRPGDSSPMPDIPAMLTAVRTKPPLRIRRHDAEEGPAYWRWDCAGCGEYGGGRHHPDAISRAIRHCAEHPAHRSSLLPPARCRQGDARLPVHPMLYAV